MHEFDDLVEKSANFPSLDGRFAALEFYIDSLSEFINFTCDQTELRLKAQIRREVAPVSQAETESRLIQLQETGRLEFSSTICGSVLVSIYFAYEASVVSIFNHLAQEKSLTSFENYKRKEKDRIKKDNNGKLNFLVLADTYSLEELGFSLFGKALNKSVLEELRMLRNSYVHNGCTLDSLSDRTKQNIVNGKYEKALGRVGLKWYITPAGVLLFFKEAHESFKYFQRCAFDN
jgi:hypothetical protein